MRLTSSHNFLIVALYVFIGNNVVHGVENNIEYNFSYGFHLANHSLGDGEGPVIWDPISGKFYRLDYIGGGQNVGLNEFSVGAGFCANEIQSFFASVNIAFGDPGNGRGFTVM